MGGFARDAGEELEHAQADVAHIVGALGEQFVAQRGEPSAWSRGRALPRERGALALGDRGLGDLEEVGIVEQLLVRGEDRGLGGIGLLKLRAQGGELSARLVDGVGEQLAARGRRRALPRSRRSPRAHLEDRADGQPGRGGTPTSRFGSSLRGRGGGAEICGSSSSPARARACSLRRRGLRRSAGLSFSTASLRVRTLGDEHDLVAVRRLPAP